MRILNDTKELQEVLWQSTLSELTLKVQNDGYLQLNYNGISCIAHIDLLEKLCFDELKENIFLRFRKKYKEDDRQVYEIS